MTPDEIAREVTHTWLREVAPIAVQMSVAPRHVHPLATTIATALRAAEARGYERAREQAAKVVVKWGYSGVVGEIRAMQETDDA